MSLDEWLEEPGNEQLLSEHNEVLERAKIHEGNRPEKGSRRRLLRRLESEQKRHEYRIRRKKTEVLFTPPMYPPCTISIYDLKKTMIKDLRCEIRSLNSYILARTVNPAVKMDAVVALVEDEEGNVVLMRILHEWLLYHGSRLDENMVLLVKQPCLQWISDKEYEIKIDHVSDIVIIPLFDGRVPLSWRDESLNDISEWSYDNWAKIGDEASKKGEHRFAVEWYTKALECSPPADIAALLLFSRSDGYFQTHQYETALRDLEKATGCPEISEHLLRRKAQVLYHLQQYQECCEAYNELLNNHPGRQSDNDRLNDAIARLAEQQHGSYNFKKMQDNAIHSRTLLLDHATYQGPVVLGESKMHGRGLFTTKAVKAGDLLLCEKAFSYTFSAKDTSSTIQVNPETKFVARGSTIDLTTATITKLQAYPSKIPQLTALHRGTFPEAITIDKANNPLIDTFLLSQITTLNSFGSPMTSQALHAHAPAHRRTMAKFACCGIWPLASFINHACDSNTRRAFIGNMMIVRATADLPAGAVLTWWYKFPSKEGVKDTAHWGFECGCALCADVRNKERWVLKMRGLLRGQIWGFVNGDASLERGLMIERIGDLEELYNRGRGVRFGVWDLCFAVARLFLRGGEEEKAVEFVVDGVWPRGEEVVVREWGVVVDEVVDAWVVLYLAFSKVAPRLAGMADRYARLNYLVCVGEADSFDEVYGKRSGRPYGPVNEA